MCQSLPYQTKYENCLITDIKKEESFFTKCKKLWYKLIRKPELINFDEVNERYLYILCNYFVIALLISRTTFKSLPEQHKSSVKKISEYFQIPEILVEKLF